MPPRYEAIRDNLISKGMPSAQAKTTAAKIYNSSRKDGEKPVTRKSE